jgi:hypothetical protein
MNDNLEADCNVCYLLVTLSTIDTITKSRGTVDDEQIVRVVAQLLQSGSKANRYCAV